jgi:FkbM family methyltransferase
MNDFSKSFHLETHLKNLSLRDDFPQDHINFLSKLKKDGFEPKVIYDIGSCVLHWTKIARKLWPDAKIILFDAFAPAEFLYDGYDYHIGVLSDKDDAIVKFYQNDLSPGGNSYYREIGFDNGLHFPADKYIEKITKRLDTLVTERGFPAPDLVKIDCQGSEVDIIMGGSATISRADKLIVELQNIEYNAGALKAAESIPIIENILKFKCTAPLFCNNGADGDYLFEKGMDCVPSP